MLMKVKTKFIQKSDTNRQGFITWDNRGQNAEEDYDDLGLSLPEGKTID